MGPLKISSNIISQKFNRELSLAPGLSIVAREALLIDFKFEGYFFRGEVPLLPGYLPLNAQSASEALKSISLTGRKLKDFDLGQSYFGLFDGPRDSQIMMALEGALLATLVSTNQLKLKNTKNVRAQQLVYAGDQEVLPASAFKIKIGRNHFKEEIEYTSELQRKFPNARIRLDPNRSLTHSELELLEPLKIDGIEFSFAECMTQKTSHKIFLDDDLSRVDISALPRGVAGLIYKPARDGAISGMSKYLSHYELTLSSTYETLLGLDHIALGALVFELKGAQGLGTYSYLKGPESYQTQWLETENK